MSKQFLIQVIESILNGDIEAATIAGSKYFGSKSQEVLGELSKETLRSYREKARNHMHSQWDKEWDAEDRGDHAAAAIHKKKGDKRAKGADKAGVKTGDIPKTADDPKFPRD